MREKELIQAAFKGQKGAYVPYSNFPVGAAVETEDGQVYTGGNIENAAYTPTICAERVAIFKAVSEGHRKIRAVAVVGGHDDPAYPCGVCRQVMAEFAQEAKIIIAKSQEDYRVYDFEDILPHAFGPKDLEVEDV